MRNVNVVLGTSSMPYFAVCLRSLLRNQLEPASIRLITDDGDAAKAYERWLGELELDTQSPISVHGKEEIDAVADERFKDWPHLRRFRDGHPCWRKVTDAWLLSPEDGEVITIDPDVYFPNKFKFEPPPAGGGILIMWQPPCCLLPPVSVRRAYDIGARLAHHVDIGVAQHTGPLDWAWLDKFLGEMGGTELPRRAHIEAICWAALLMRSGGGYLNPTHWICWRQSLSDRIRLKLGWSALAHIAAHGMAQAKCFHAGGAVKHLLPEAEKQGLFDAGATLDTPSTPLPAVELTRAMYERTERVKGVARLFGLARQVG